jgi:hypothetical protein
MSENMGPHSERPVTNRLIYGMSTSYNTIRTAYGTFCTYKNLDAQYLIRYFIFRMTFITGLFIKETNHEEQKSTGQWCCQSISVNKHHDGILNTYVEKL